MTNDPFAVLADQFARGLKLPTTLDFEIGPFDGGGRGFASYWIDSLGGVDIASRFVLRCYGSDRGAEEQRVDGLGATVTRTIPATTRRDLIERDLALLTVIAHQQGTANTDNLRSICYALSDKDGDLIAQRTKRGDATEVDRQSHRGLATVAGEELATSVDRLLAFAADRGVALSMPPNPYASLRCPGSTFFIVLTAPGFGRVRWLPEQLSFVGRLDSITFVDPRVRRLEPRPIV